MTPQEAKEILLFQSGAHDEIDDPRWESGFLRNLRPFTGLREENFHQIMEAIRALAPTLSNSKTCDTGVVSALWSICHLGRAWGLDSEGMLQRNGILNHEDTKRLQHWINNISYTCHCLFDGCDVDTAFEDYDHSLATGAP